MNSNLVAVQRPDKTGKVVTRHVRSSPVQKSGTSAMPAPSVTKAAPMRKYTAAQKKQKPREYSIAMYDGDAQWRDYNKELLDTAHGKLKFTASNAEMFDVLSAVDKPGSALTLLNLGITTADEARAHMKGLGVEQTSKERAGLIDLAVRRGMGMNFFLDHVETFEEALRENPDHDPDNVIDSIAFYTSRLSGGNGETRTAILEGRISHKDIKAIGVPVLASRRRMKVMHDSLIKLNSGTADFTTDDMKELLRMAASEDLIDPALESVVKMIEPAGIKAVLGVPRLGRIASAYDHYHHQTKWSSLTYDEKMDRATYAVRIIESSGDAGTHVDYDRFYAEGIPAELAGSVIARGGTVQEAKAIHEVGIAPSIAEGWL